jgi:predicted RNA-binding Zn ribbon-like protein
MQDEQSIRGDWRDGFVFVGNSLLLDFVNTRPVINGETLEFLPDSAALVRWLVAAELIASDEATEVLRAWGPGEESELEALRAFRDQCRAMVFDLEAGEAPASSFIDQLNDLLADHPFTERLVEESGILVRRRCFAPIRPADAFGPLLDSTLDLLTTADRTRIRKCAACVLHFLDTSKKGTRRWCSMQICGNRYKVAAYAKRVKDRRF